MYFATVPLWIFAAILYFSDKKSKSNFWLSATAFFAGLGGVSVFLLEHVTPYVGMSMANRTALLSFLNVIICFFSLGGLLLYPYCLLIFSFHFSDIFTSRHALLKRALTIGFLIPVSFILLITPSTHYSSPDTVPPLVDFIVLWALICFLSASFMLAYSYLKSKTNIERTQRLLVCILVIPSSLASLCTTYISHWTGINIWRYNSIIALLILAIFTLFAARYGILGLKLRWELQKLDRRIKTSSIGTSALNHAIKNELQNINACNQMIKILLQAADDPNLSSQISGKIDTVQNSIDRLIIITARINKQTRDISLDESVCDLTKLIDFSVNSIKPVLQGKNIRIVKNINHSVKILCDRIHMQEVLINILKNSIDSINDQGDITINVYKFRKHLSLVIADNGSGISRDNIKYVFEPFFSTKSSHLNFGFGLTYCFNVMRKHNGTLEIKSEEGKGTSVTLNFSPKKVIEADDGFPDRKPLHADASKPANNA